jgi:outer membrane protein OmpA-like peptidoglycan-associated protein
MKKILPYIMMLAAGLIFAVPAEAQTIRNIINGEVPVTIKSLRQVDDSVYVSIDMDLTNLTLSTERQIIVTPILISGDNQYKLKSLMINGSLKHKAFLREVALNGWGDQVQNAHQGILNLKDNRGVYSYNTAIGYSSWMRGAHMDMVSDLCGCGTESAAVYNDKVADRIVMDGARPYRVLPNVAYMRPEVEQIKARAQVNDVFLDFPVSQANIDPNFGNNPRELRKIETIINEIRSDQNVRVSGVTITGYASPEGEINFNNQLSRGRAEALRNLLASNTNIPANLYRVGQGGEDWEGLIRSLQQSHIEPKQQIISTIRYFSPVQRKDRLKALGGGMVWQQMLNELFPPLRRVESRIAYTVRGFNVNEAKEIIKTRPQQLSLNEMFLVANTYEEGSPEFVEVFETAVKQFPDDPVANLNAAASALLNGDTEKAIRYLRKAQRNNPVYYNNLGVLSMMQGNLRRAKSLFQHAAESKLEPALKNLEEVKKKEAADLQLTN